MPVQEKYGDGMVTGKEVNETLLFWILVVTMLGSTSKLQ